MLCLNIIFNKKKANFIKFAFFYPANNSIVAIKRNIS